MHRNFKGYKNANIVLMGATGAGKTFASQLIALRLREQGTQVFAIVPLKGHEYHRACTKVGGTFVQISPASSNCINIMEIRKVDRTVSVLLDGETTQRSELAMKIQSLHIFFSLLIPDMTYEERQLLDEAMVRTYEEKGITHDNESLEDPQNPGKYKPMPILGDLYNVLLRSSETRRLANILNRLVNGSAKTFNQQTNINLDNKYVVLDISELSGDLLPVGMYVALDYTATCTITVSKRSTPSRPTPTPTEITVEVSADEGAVSVTASVSGNTATITAPTDAQMEEITGKGKETGEVTIDLSSLPDTVTAVAIPAETVKAIDEAMEAGGDGLTVKLPNSTVTFDADALESIAEQTTGSDLKLNVEPITESKLNAAQKKTLTDLDVQAVYDVYLTSGGKRISDFGGGKASVEVTHTVKDGQKPGGVAVWYVAEAGGKTRIPTTTSEKAVRFTVSHFSDYVLTYDETLPGACEKDDTCPMTGFTDLDKSKWYHDGVHWALEEGVMSGYGGGRFGPNDTTTRAQIVQMLWNLEGKPKTSHTLTFKDVASDKWYTEAIRWASEKKLVSGYSSEKFGPDDKLTREQLATILNRYAKYKGMDTSAGEKNKLSGFTDAQQISSWAEPSFRWAVDAGIIAGVGGGRLSPKTDASRAQVATMLMRYEIIAQ